MRSETQMGFEEWLPRRAALLTAAGIWAAGFALAGASALRMQHTTVATTDGMNEAPTSPASTFRYEQPTDTPADTAESESAVFMGGDVVVGRRPPRRGVAQMQKR
jgi:hypothetical protein